MGQSNIERSAYFLIVILYICARDNPLYMQPDIPDFFREYNVVIMLSSSFIVPPFRIHMLNSSPRVIDGSIFAEFSTSRTATSICTFDKVKQDCTSSNN